jgi:hypothetical protein
MLPGETLMVTKVYQLDHIYTLCGYDLLCDL